MGYTLTVIGGGSGVRRVPCSTVGEAMRVIAHWRSIYRRNWLASGTRGWSFRKAPAWYIAEENAVTVWQFHDPVGRVASYSITPAGN